MKFIGRDAELQIMEQMYQRDSFQMLVLYGRRRIGKTTLLNKFSEDKNSLYYTGIESKDNENLRQFGQSAFEYFYPGMKGANFTSFSDVFDFITSCVKKSPNDMRHLIILDEYPYMAERALELSSVLQREIDREWKNLNIMLVLCGSSITFMEEEVLSEKAPLFGRRTGQMDLKPFDYKESSLFTPNYSPEEKAIVYGITGGIAKYLSIIDPKLSLKENIISQFLNTSGYFYEEPKNLLRQEFRDVSLYYAILNVIGSGATQVNEIAEKTGFDVPKVSQALRKLESVRIVRKEVPILNENNKKLTRYFLSDGMFKFWFKFIPKAINAVERNCGAQYYQSIIEPMLHEYMGGIFEQICQEYAIQKGLNGTYGGMMTRVGKWRGNDSAKKCPADIDVVMVNDVNKIAIIGECKFRNAPFGKEEYETLLDRARLIAPYRIIRYLIFALSGVTDWVKNQNDPNVEIITIQSMY